MSTPRSPADCLVLGDVEVLIREAEQQGGQAAVSAGEVAAVDADTLGVNEMHGTGTSLGDPIEAASLAVAGSSLSGAMRRYIQQGTYGQSSFALTRAYFLACGHLISTQ